MSAAIELIALRKEFAQRRQKTVAVDGIDLCVDRGEVFGMLGPNGAGKTTTLEICEGLQSQTSGEVRVLGRQWSVPAQVHELRQRIGVSLQETRFFDKQTVRETLTLFRSFYEHGPSVDEAIDLASLRDKADARTQNLSGGQRQRLAVAAALVGEPELLFLDEPTTGLDPQSRRNLWDIIRSYRNRGGTVLLTTHYMDEAEQLADRIGIIDQGRLIALDTPARLIRSLDGGHAIEVHAAGIGDLMARDLDAVPGVRHVLTGAGWLRLTVDAPHQSVPALMQLLDSHGIEMSGLHTRHTSLEDVFVHLTGRSLAEADQ